MSTLTPPGNPLDKTYELPAAPDRAFAALTEPPRLTVWFAEHAHVEPREGGAYRFWGRHTPWIAAEAQSDGRIVAIEPPHRLSYVFRWRESLCRVDLDLTASGDDASRLRVRMKAEAPYMGFHEEVGWCMLDFWRAAAGNLRHYLRSGAAALRPDYLAGGPLDMSIFVAAPPERVFRALTEPPLMDRWLSAKARVDPRRGGTFSFGWTLKGNDGRDTVCGPSRIIEIEPNRLLVHDWSHRDEPASTVRWSLTPVPGGTLVRLTHDIPPGEPIRGGYVGGWSSFLVELGEFAPAV